MRLILTLATVFCLVSCQHKVPQQSNHLEELANLMQGHFDSSKQSQSDVNYYNISLKMKRIWPEFQDAIWLYVEQAVSARMDKPYRQRVYKLTQTPDGRYSSAVYEMPNSELYVGGYESPEMFLGLTKDDLTSRTGCAVILQRVSANNYQGETEEKNCLSSLRGASYASSQVTITETYISSWDQGYNSADEQVWGATQGPYIFDRK